MEENCSAPQAHFPKEMAAPDTSAELKPGFADGTIFSLSPCLRVNQNTCYKTGIR